MNSAQHRKRIQAKFVITALDQTIRAPEGKTVRLCKLSHKSAVPILSQSSVNLCETVCTLSFISPSALQVRDGCNSTLQDGKYSCLVFQTNSAAIMMMFVVVRTQMSPQLMQVLLNSGNRSWVTHKITSHTCLLSCNVSKSVVLQLSKNISLEPYPNGVKCFKKMSHKLATIRCLRQKSNQNISSTRTSHDTRYASTVESQQNDAHAETHRTQYCHQMRVKVQ